MTAVPGGPKFVVADDHPMVCDALATALRQRFAAADIAIVASADEVTAHLEADAEVDALLVDLDMPGMNGLTGLATWRATYPAVPVIVVSATRDPAVMRRAIDLGAAAYLPKSSSLEEIARVVGAVMEGEVFEPPEAAAGDHDSSDFAERVSQLTPQQWRVLALMVQGEPNKIIAYKLGVGEATIKAHVTTILRKLGVRSRTQAVILARHLSLPGDATSPVRP